jgi:hypothetical protein
MTATMQGNRMPSAMAAVPSTRISSVEARMAMDHNPALLSKNRRARRNVKKQVSAMPTELKNRHASDVGPSTASARTSASRSGSACRDAAGR